MLQKLFIILYIVDLLIVNSYVSGQFLNYIDIDEYKKMIKPNAPAGTRLDLEVGDMLVYSGCELEHWREPFEGDSCGQVFLHYNNLYGQFKDINIFDFFKIK